MNWYLLSQNINIKDVVKYPNLPWNIQGLSCNKDITLDIISNFNKLIDYEELSKYITIEDVITNNHLPWCKYGLSCNKGITISVIDELYLPNAKRDWCWDSLSSVIDIQEVINNPTKDWNYWTLCYNPGITIDYINNHKDLHNELNWDALSELLPIQDILNNKYYNWNRYYLSMNLGITLDIVEELSLPHIQGLWNTIHIPQTIKIRNLGSNWYDIWQEHQVIVDYERIYDESYDINKLQRFITPLLVTRYPNNDYEMEIVSGISVEDLHLLGKLSIPKIIPQFKNAFWDIIVLVGK